MPKKLNFVKIKSNLNANGVDFFYNSIRKTTVQTVQTVKCTECKQEIVNHKMVVQRLDCVSKHCNSVDKQCAVKYKTIKCLKTSNYTIYQLNSHQNEDDSNSIDVNERHGFSKELKIIIEKLIHQKEITLPRKIRDYLILNQTKYNLAFVPSLTKFQNYIQKKSEQVF